jgi:DNA-binding response OmpR family regulator
MRLLVIEDYLPIQRAVVKGLREAGYAVDAAADGEEGLWYGTSNEYDVIILDLMLPKLDGLTVLQRLREKGRPVHVLILTAKDAVADRVRGLDLGADDYLVKPFAFEELLARVRALGRRAYCAKNPSLEVGDLKIETTTQRVWRGKHEVRLTPREYVLLEYLAMRAGQVVTRTDIWEHIYEFNPTPTPTSSTSTLATSARSSNGPAPPRSSIPCAAAVTAWGPNRETIPQVAAGGLDRRRHGSHPGHLRGPRSRGHRASHERRVQRRAGRNGTGHRRLRPAGRHKDRR